MSELRSRSVPAPGQAPLVAPNAAALLRRNADEFGDRVAIKFGDRSWTHREFFEESCRFAAVFYFAGCNADWIRVDGENFPAAPIEEALRKAPGVVLAAAYGVPDDQAGDQVMAGLVLAENVVFDPARFTQWLDGQDAIGPKWRPRYVRILRDPPTTGTNKIVKRTFVHQKFRRDRVGADELFVRERGAAVYRTFDTGDERALYDSFVQYQRERFWDL